MLRFILQRIILIAPILLGLSLLMAFFIRLLPGNPCATILGERATSEALRRCEHLLGYDLPIWQQYLDYVSRALHGDFGTASTGARVPVLRAFLERFPATMELAVAAMSFAIGLGIPLGVVSAKYRGTVFDMLAAITSLIGISIPVFFQGLLLVYLFGVTLHWLPAGGRFDASRFIFKEGASNFLLWEALIINRNIPEFLDVVRHLILPAVTLGTIPLAFVNHSVECH